MNGTFTHTLADVLLGSQLSSQKGINVIPSSVVKRRSLPSAFESEKGKEPFNGSCIWKSRSKVPVGLSIVIVVRSVQFRSNQRSDRAAFDGEGKMNAAAITTMNGEETVIQ